MDSGSRIRNVLGSRSCITSAMRADPLARPRTRPDLLLWHWARRRPNRRVHRRSLWRTAHTHRSKIYRGNNSRMRHHLARRSHCCYSLSRPPAARIVKGSTAGVRAFFERYLAINPTSSRLHFSLYCIGSGGGDYKIKRRPRVPRISPGSRPSSPLSRHPSRSHPHLPPSPTHLKPQNF